MKKQQQKKTPLWSKSLYDQIFLMLHKKAITVTYNTCVKICYIHIRIQSLWLTFVKKYEPRKAIRNI